MGIIFDLDQTLIDSAALEKLRRARKWPETYKLIPKVKVYDGISEILNWLNQNSIPIAIVTNSPESYCRRFINYHKWIIAATVCYHDVKKRKPNPEPMNLALKKLGLENNDVISIGDKYDDMLSSQSANIKCIAALWGTEERNLLMSSNADFFAKNTLELNKIIQSFFI